MTRQLPSPVTLVPAAPRGDRVPMVAFNDHGATVNVAADPADSPQDDSDSAAAPATPEGEREPAQGDESNTPPAAAGPADDVADSTRAPADVGDRGADSLEPKTNRKPAGKRAPASKA